MDAPSATGNDQLNIGNTIYGDMGSGNVGIGTNSPAALLHIKSSTANGKLIIDGASGQEADIDLYENGVRKWQIGYSAGSDLLGFYNDVTDTYDMVIQDDGNVGIGTTNPGTWKLSVNGNAKIANGDEGYLGVGSHGALIYDSTPKLLKLQAGNWGSSIQLETRQDGTTYHALTMDGYGNVGIGTTGPSAKLDVVGNAEINGDLTVTGNVTGISGRVLQIMYDGDTVTYGHL